MKRFFRIVLLTITYVLVWCCVSDDIYATEVENPIKICIDPGHGGENLGAEWLDYTEKDITMQVAQAMKEELEKYENIEVFLTRTTDVDMDLGERIDYAKSVDADFFFCLHFNMSVDHDIYGTENWISAFGKNYARGMDFAKIEMGLLTELGLYDRGIKTKLNSKGTNYYGVLRLGDEAGIPGVIIEHCHLDNPNDEPFYDHSDWLDKYGKLDATAVAMYYGLYSPELGKDFRDYSYIPTEIPQSKVRPDTSEPEKADFELGNITVDPVLDENGNIIDYKATAPIKVTGFDSDSRMLYYSVSFDGGNTFSERYPWQGDSGDIDNTIENRIELPFDRQLNVAVNVYNLFDLFTTSECKEYASISKPEIVIEENINTSTIDKSNNEDLNYETISHNEEFEFDVDTKNQAKDRLLSIKENSFLLILVCVLAVAALLVILIIVYFCIQFGKHNRRKKRRKRHKKIDKR